MSLTRNHIVINIIFYCITVILVTDTSTGWKLILFVLFLNSLRASQCKYSIFCFCKTTVNIKLIIFYWVSMEPEKLIVGLDAQELGRIYAGEVHYSRIPVEYWEHRILMIKAMGLNALSVYIMWNFHEVTRGEFDYTTDNKNLSLFLELAQKHKMMVLFRPGPYVCAEWDFGGLPARLLSVKGLVIRSNNHLFLEETRIYFESLLPIMKSHTRTIQNPDRCIVMLQIQNEYGFYGSDKNYMQSIRKIWKDMGVSVPEYYVDWERNIDKCHWEGAHMGVNNLNDKGKAKTARKLSKQGMILGGQIYSGWMTHWGSKWGGKPIQDCMKDYQFLLKEGYSFAMYMVHGGTNFGLTAGANGSYFKVPLLNLRDYYGAVTSYDYDAPINQQGSPTDKYHSLKHQICTNALWEVPAIPDSIPMITINPIDLIKKATLFENLPEPIISKDFHPFQTEQLQMFHQGIVVYQTEFPQIKDYSVSMVIHDFALVFIGKKFLKSLDRSQKVKHKISISKKDIFSEGNKLRIIVEGMGHINFSKYMLTDFKGLIEFEGIKNISEWKMYKIPVDNNILQWDQLSENAFEFPTLYEGKFELTEIGDTYLDLSGYGKGYVWVNGYNLGRYWSIGPQQRLFCPGAWMKKQTNTICVLNISGSGGSSIKGVKLLDDNYYQNRSNCPIM